MRRLLQFTPLMFALVLVLAMLAVAGPSNQASAARSDAVPDNYIVTFKPGINAQSKASEKARAYGLQIRHVYDSTINGFAGFIPSGQLKRLQNDPDVVSIVQDRRVFAFNDVRPSGIRRTQAHRNSTSLIGSHTNPIDVDVAVIDSGIQPDHPDLNVVGGVSCVPGEPSHADANGHGTHVAGTIAALDNGSGVVGMAPGARLWAVRVLNALGEAQFSDVICGIDWVTANADTIEVVNMSLGGEAPYDTCADGSLHAAICGSVAAGVTYVVASGNSGMDASSFVPAAYPEVITVSAIVDTDGAPGGKGTTSFLYGDDDELATFSNYGAPVDIAAPGVNIYSTWPGGYNYSSGTSMASPHVAGAAAIYLHLNPSASPVSVQSYLLAIAWQQGTADGFTQDVDGFAEPLLNAGAIGGSPLPPPAPECTLSASEGTVGSSIKVTCVNFGSRESVRIYWDSTATSQRALFIADMEGNGTATMTIPDSTSGEHQIIARGVSSGIELSAPFTVRPGIKLSASTGKVGAFTTVTLSGFAANQSVSVSWDGGSSPVATATTSATGRASFGLTIPEAAVGEHTLVATGTGSQGLSAQATFTVIPSVTLSPSVGKIGTAITISLRGYAAGEQIDVTWQDSATRSTSIGRVTASSLGSASTSFTVPEATRGAHLIEGVGGSSNSATAPFTVAPVLTLSSATGSVGSNLAVTLSGFASAESVALRWYDTSTATSLLASVVTSDRGSASISVAIPDATGGSHRLEAVGTSSGSSSAYFIVKAALALMPDSGLGGSEVTTTMSGFRAGETITVKWFNTTFNSTTVASATASGKGSATVTFVVPADAAAGDHKVEANGSSSFARPAATFTVESSGPTPSLDPACSIDPISGPVGTRVAVTCINFAVNESIRIYWDDMSLQRASIWTGTAGGGTAMLTIPDTTAGSHRVIAAGATSGFRSEQPFTVAPSLSLSTSSAKVGGFVLVTAKGFAANETVTFRWDSGAGLKTASANPSGTVSTSFAVPEAARGEHSVEAIGGTSAATSGATITVVPSMSVSPTSGAVGSTTSIALRGYGAGEAVAITWYDGAAPSVLVPGVTTSQVGSATVNFTVPDAVGGDHRIDGIGTTGSSTSTNFRIRPALSLTPTSGTVGSLIDVVLTGFAAGETITVQWFETSTTASTIATVTASGSGSVAATLTVPESAGATHKVLFTGSVSGASVYQYYSVNASLSLAPVSGPVGATVTVALTGYRSEETIKVAWFNTSSRSIPIASTVANSTGAATVSFTVPGDATSGGHKVEATGQSSFRRTSATFTVVAPEVNGTPGIQSLGPTFDTPVVDDFSQGSNGGAPPGWSVAPGSTGEITVGQRGNRVDFGAAPGTSGDAWLIRDGATFSQPDVQVKLRVSREGSGTGVILAWNGPDNYIAVVADSQANRIEVIELVGGVARTILHTNDGSITFDHGKSYWLRAEAGVGNGTWINVYWSADGNQFEPVGVAEGLLGLTGGVGLVTNGNNLPNVDFDDFVARVSQSTAPVRIDSEATEQPAEPTEIVEPTPAPTEEPATPEPSPTDEPTLTEEPTATEEPTIEPTPSTESTPTAELTSETPQESDSTPSDAEPSLEGS